MMQPNSEDEPRLLEACLGAWLPASYPVARTHDHRWVLSLQHDCPWLW